MPAGTVTIEKRAKSYVVVSEKGRVLGKHGGKHGARNARAQVTAIHLRQHGIPLCKAQSWHVVPNGDEWTVHKTGARSGRHFPTKEKAVQFGRKVARKWNHSHLVIHRADGTVEDHRSYGSNPKCAGGEVKIVRHIRDFPPLKKWEEDRSTHRRTVSFNGYHYSLDATGKGRTHEAFYMPRGGEKRTRLGTHNYGTAGRAHAAAKKHAKAHLDE